MSALPASPLAPPVATPVTLREQLRACRERVAPVCAGVPAPYPAFTLIFSITDGRRRAHVLHVCGPGFEQTWDEGARQIEDWARRRALHAPWLRVDWVEGVSPIGWARFEAQLAGVKRNYFRLGLALDARFARVLTEQELNANAMLYAGPQVAHAAFNKNNFEIYLRQRFAHEPAADFEPGRTVYLLATGAVFCQADGVVHRLAGPGLDAGRRQLPTLTARAVAALVDSGAAFLARQVQDSGQFVYGHFPCFDRRIPGYNTLRHASTLYAMLEAWELNRDPQLLAAIERGLEFLRTRLIRSYTLPDGTQAAFLVDVGDEIKLGGNAVCLLALVKHCEATGTRAWLPLLERLALGIAHMQDAKSGRFNHVLNAADLSLKQASRIIYYDGEAAFGLMRLYGLTRDPRWLAMVERAFEHFIASQHWQAHDHWLSYCVNELTRWRAHEKYFRFGIQNVAGVLDFVLDRKTTFPTLLELMLAAQRMLRRLQAMPALRHLLGDIDLDKFRRALDFRAHYLLNGHFWPELAMYFRQPQAIVGAFFIRHHAFRVRIDDVEHYLSGLVGYQRLLAEREAAPAGASVGAGADAQWSAAELAQASGGHWVAPPPGDWRCGGVAPRLLPQRSHVLSIGDGRRGARATAAQRALHGLLRPPAAILCREPGPHLGRGVPVLQVASVRDATLALARHARSHFGGAVVGVAGRHGETAQTAALLAQALGAWGAVGRPEGNTRTPAGAAWNLSCLPRRASAWVIELGLAPPPALIGLVRPTVLLLGSEGAPLPAPVATEEGGRAPRLPPGALPSTTRVVLCRDSAEHAADAAAAHAQGLALLTYGEHPQADVRLLAADQGELQLQVQGRVLQMRLNAAGHAMAIGASAAMAAVLALGLPLAGALEALGRFVHSGSHAAVHAVPVGAGVFHLIDQSYDANPASMRAALALLGQTPCPPLRRVALLGDMHGAGPGARAQHEALAAPLLAARPDRVLLCGPLMQALHERIQGQVCAHWFADVTGLWDALGGLVRPDDWVLAKASRAIGLGRLTRALKAMS